MPLAQFVARMMASVPRITQHYNINGLSDHDATERMVSLKATRYDYPKVIRRIV